MNDQSDRKRVIILSFLVFLMGCFTLYSIFFRGNTVGPSTNMLALGPDATISTLKIPLVNVASVNTMSRAELFEIRSEQALKHQALLAGPYAPSDLVFSRVENDKPWWSFKGFFFDGRKDEMSPGAIAEGRWIFNPYVLIAPEFWGLSIWQNGTVKWNKDAITEEQLSSMDFPYAPEAVSLVFNPTERTAQVAVDVTAFIRKATPYVTAPLPSEQIQFGITAYNAADLGLPYVQFDPEHSENVTNPKQPEKSRWINDAVGFSPDICGNTGGCNHRNNVMEMFSSLVIAKLPAKAAFKLWHGATREPNPPELTYTIEFR